MGEHVVLCQTGVQQGDPLTPVLFSLGLHEAVEACAEVTGLSQQWFLDDGALRAKFRALENALRVLEPALRNIGLEINNNKCEIYAKDMPDPGVLTGVLYIPDQDKWSYLGVPHGKEQRRLRGRCQTAGILDGRRSQHGRTLPATNLPAAALHHGRVPG